MLLISLDTTRADHCSVLGYERDTTPNLTRIAAESVLFEQAYSPTATTGPTHATMFTSLYPIAHGLVKNGLPLVEEHLTLAEILGGAGYQTAGFASSYVLHGKFGYGQGFDLWFDEFDAEEATHKPKRWAGEDIEGYFDRRGDHTTDRAIRWLEESRDPELPFLLFVHYFDPHGPYTPPEPFARRFAPTGSPEQLDRTIGRYDGEIAFTDEQIGRLVRALDRLGLAADTLLVIAADHGEGLMQHGHMKHGLHIYEEAVRVPLLVRWPGKLPAGRVIAAPVSLVDLTPTVLDLCGVTAGEASFQGGSLAAALRGDETLDPERPVILQRRHYKGGRYSGIYAEGEKFGIRSGVWKYIEGEAEQTWELFRLDEDPGETRNIHDEFPEVAADLASRLEVWREAHARETPITGEMSEEDLERLRSLGYVQ